MKEGKKITIDGLAVIINRSFQHVEDRFNHLEKEMKDGFFELRSDMKDVKFRLDVIEGKLINNHENRITRLEDDVRVLKSRN